MMQARRELAGKNIQRFFECRVTARRKRTLNQPLSKSYIRIFLAWMMAGSTVAALANKIFQVDVKTVMVSFTVKDDHGRYVSGLKPQDICVREDGVKQHVDSLAEIGPEAKDAPALAAANSVFVLFDTSNCMYKGFAHAEDRIEEFIRSLDARQAVAVYSFSQNMTRLARLTSDHDQAVRALRMAVAGDSTAMLNATLLTLRDAALVPGRKIVVVFSNGPDDSSIVAPNDVARVAEEEGIPIDIIATKIPNEICRNAFGMLSDSSDGKLFMAETPSSQAQNLP
jgi:VWFA-related protein